MKALYTKYLINSPQFENLDLQCTGPNEILELIIVLNKNLKFNFL